MSTAATPFGFQFATSGDRAAASDTTATAATEVVGAVETSNSATDFMKGLASLVLRAVDEDEEQEEVLMQPVLPGHNYPVTHSSSSNSTVNNNSPSLLQSHDAAAGSSTPPTAVPAGPFLVSEGNGGIPGFPTSLQAANFDALNPLPNGIGFPTILPVPNFPPSPQSSAPGGNGSVAGAGGSSHQAPPPAYDNNTTMHSVGNGLANSTTSSHGIPPFYGNSGIANGVSGLPTVVSTAFAPVMAPALTAVAPALLATTANGSVVPLSAAGAPGAVLAAAPASPPPTSSTTSVPVLDPNDADVRSNLFVCNLPQEVNDDRLKEIFGRFGTIQSAKVMLNIRTGESRGIAFVKFTTPASAEAALKEMNDSDIFSETTRLIVRVANAKAAYLPGAPTNKTFVRNVPVELTKQDLIDFFSQYGEVVDVSVHADTAGENAAAAAAAAAAGVRLPTPQPRKITVAPLLAGHTDEAGSPNSDGHSGSAEEEEKKLNIVFVTFADKESAKRAADATHTKMPFKECNGTPLLSKVAEDNFRRNERLNRKFARVAPAGSSSSTSSQHPQPSQPSALPLSASATTLVSAPFGFPTAGSVRGYGSGASMVSSGNTSMMGNVTAAPGGNPLPAYAANGAAVAPMFLNGPPNAAATGAFLYSAAAPGTIHLNGMSGTEAAGGEYLPQPLFFFSPQPSQQPKPQPMPMQGYIAQNGTGGVFGAGPQAQPQAQQPTQLFILSPEQQMQVQMVLQQQQPQQQLFWASR